MVVPYCYQCAPGAQPAILTIANAYTALVVRRQDGRPGEPRFPVLTGNVSATLVPAYNGRMTLTVVP